MFPPEDLIQSSVAVKLAALGDKVHRQWRFILPPPTTGKDPKDTKVPKEQGDLRGFRYFYMGQSVC